MTPTPFRLPDEPPAGEAGFSRGLPTRPAQPRLPSGPPAPTVGPAPTEDPIQVRPVRAAFGPAISLVSVDEQGRLWMRLSTAVSIMLGGLVLFLVPLVALWWIGVGLMDTGRITIEEHAPAPTESTTLSPAKQRR